MPLLLLNLRAKGAGARRPAVGPIPRAGRAFSLVEMLLVTVLILSLGAALVFSFTDLFKSAQLEEGAGRMESLLRFARAQAAQTGKKVQIVFRQDSPPSESSGNTSTAGSVELAWEPDPLGQPGHFESMNETTWPAEGIGDLVNVDRVKIDTGAASAPALSSEDDFDWFEEEEFELAASEPARAITFFPDGTSDSAEIFLSPCSQDSERRICVRIAGMTGAITQEVLSENAGPDESEPPAPVKNDRAKPVTLEPEPAE